MKIEEIPIQPFYCSQSCMKCGLGCERKWFLKYRWGLDLKTVEVKESADLGQIYHKYQQVGPGREQEVRAWVLQRQQNLMRRIDKGEDLDGIWLGLSNLFRLAQKKQKQWLIFSGKNIQLQVISKQ